MTKYEKIEVAEVCSEFHIDPEHRFYGFQHNKEEEGSPYLIFSGGAATSVGSYVYMFEHQKFFNTDEGPKWDDVLAAQYRLTNGHYLVILDFADNSYRESAPFGRAVFHRGDIHFYHLDENGEVLRHDTEEFLRARWVKQTEPLEKYRRPALTIDTVELISPDKIRIETKDRLEFQVCFFKRNSTWIPAARRDFAKHKYLGLNVQRTAYYVRRVRRIRWCKWQHVFDDAIDLFLGLPVRTFHRILAAP